MHNRLRLLPPAKDALLKAGGDAREEFLRCFEYIQEYPFPFDRKGHITALPRGSTVVYVYDDGAHIIEYYVDVIPGNGAVIDVLGIDIQGSMLPY